MPHIRMKEAMKVTEKIKKLQPLEVFYEMGQRYGILMTAYQITLSSKEKIKPDDVLLALHWLFRRVPTLRLCIREEKEEFWFAEMKEENLDFKAFRSSSVNDQLHAMTHTSYNSAKGPLWRARFIEVDNESPVPLPQMVSTFPHQSQFFLGIHHAITDGYSNLKIVEFFVEMLNKIILKEPIEEHQLGVFSSGQQTIDLLETRKAELLSDPKRFEQVKEEVRNAIFNVNTLWVDSFGVNENAENKTLHLSDRVSEEITQKFLKKLKSFRISINSGMCALINVVLVEMMKEKGPDRESYNVGTLHGVNMRQYWLDDNKVHFGLQLGLMRIYIETSNNDPSNFWNYAIRVNSILQEKVKTKWPLSEQIAQGYFLTNDIDELHKLFQNENPPHTLLYTASSLGNVSRIVEFCGEHVQWTTLSRTTSAHYLACPLSVNFQVFRKLLCYSVEYITKYVSDDLASIVLNNITKKIYSVSED